MVIWREYVITGQLKFIFWPVLNHGDASFNATKAVECVAQQDMDAFWQMHAAVFAEASGLYRAGRPFYRDLAVEFDVDGPTFEACYDDPATAAFVVGLDEVRRERGIVGQPVFDIGGQILFGNQPFPTFVEVIEDKLAGN